ncbi:MAG TPA: NADPH-dependent FMN reductase [Jatrophihabitantaceae bacterium]|nr:NADPH-dependent FMN reductase [Jatrophihabitantaceae bacterium]
MIKPLVVGIGGTLRAGSTNELALRLALEAAAEAGATTQAFCGEDLGLPFYDPTSPERTDKAKNLVEALRAASGVIVASPGYHGGLSGIIKNAIDYIEDMAKDDRVYLEDLPFGCISVAFGSQAAVAVLSNLRNIAHALRAYPTPYGAAIVGGPKIFAEGACLDENVAGQLRLVGKQVTDMAIRSLRVAA